MTERRYTVAEIDALRRCFDIKYVWGSYSYPARDGMSFSYTKKDKVATVEQWVRTAMLAGHTAEDLIASERASAGSPERRND